MIICQICGHTETNFIVLHLKNVHGINANSYRELYPNIETFLKQNKNG